MWTGLSTVFGAGVRVRNASYDRGLLKQKRLEGPVISIGNISVGGSGKTPFTILLGGWLKSRGIAFDVLSRGYGRKRRGVFLVNPSGTASDFGDEPLLIARKLGVPVIVGEDRFEAGRCAEQSFGARLHLLDDGFQHRQLAREFDIVLLTGDDIGDQLLPKGRLREPMRALRRADAIVLMPGAEPDGLPLAGKRVWRAKRNIAVRNVSSRPVAFCGVARPRSFLMQLRAAGVEPVAEAIFRDHHAYDERDVRDLLKVREQTEADGFVTTEKDAVNLGELLQSLQPMSVIPVRMELLDCDRVLTGVIDTVNSRLKSRT